MPVYRARIGDQKLTLHCAAAFKEYALWFLGEVEQQHAAGQTIFAGMCISCGWSVVTLRADGDSLAVCEPDFDGDPLRAVRPDLTCTFQVFDRQRQLLKRLGLDEGDPARFDEEIIAVRSCLDKPRVVIKRFVDGTGAAGWAVLPVEPLKAGGYQPERDLVKLPVWQLLRKRPSLVQVLALPKGFGAVFDGDKLLWVENAAGEHLWEDGGT